MLEIVLILVGFLVVGAFILVLQIGLGDPLNSEEEQEALRNMTDPGRVLDRARELEEQELWSQAVSARDRDQERVPGEHHAPYRRGYDLYREGEYHRALTDFERVLEEDDGDRSSPVQLYRARTLKALERGEDAFSAYQTYLETNPNPEVGQEAAQLARHLDKCGEARNLLDRVRERGERNHFIEATLLLVEMALEEGLPERASPYLEELEECRQQQQMSTHHRLEFQYRRAQWLSMTDREEEAEELYRDIYRERPSFMDVQAIVEEQLAEMTEQELIQKFLRLGRSDFVELCQSLVNLLDYEIISTDSLTPEEVDIVGRDKAVGFKVNRILFAFKQWGDPVGEFPVKEFEMKLLENRYDHGFLVSPGGFNPKAKQYAEGNPDLELMGPQKLLVHLRNQEKETLIE